MTDDRGAPHLPRPAPIDGYGKGGFRFAGMSHRGSLLCLPSGVHAWPVTQAVEIDESALEPVFAEAGEIAFLLVGTGRDAWIMPQPLRARFRELGIPVEVTQTGAAVSTYNILLGERRRVAAALIAVE